MTDTLLIGLDGATFTVLDQLMEEGHMPHLARLCHGGVRGVLRSTPNPFTPPSWTSLATGCRPGNHGIFDFVTVTPSDGARRPTFRIATSRDIRRETIWSVAGRRGRRVACLNFPVAFPPAPIDGVVVPGFLPPRHLRGHVHPREFYDRIRCLPGFDASELVLDFDLERESLQVLPHERYEDWLSLHIRREARWRQVASTVINELDCHIVAIILDGTDKLQHLCWRFIDKSLLPARPTDWERRVRALCVRFFEDLDEHIHTLARQAGHDANIVICSDHGFTATHEIVHINTLLERLGYLRWGNGVLAESSSRVMPTGHSNPTLRFAWEDTIAYGLTAGCNGIYVHRARQRGEPGVTNDRARAVTDRLREDLLAFRDDDGRRVLLDVMRSEDAFPGTCTDLAPDLTVVLRDRGFVSVLRGQEVVARRPEILGTHHPDGVFVACGPAFHRGAQVAGFGIQDVAAVLLHATGVELPADLDAVLPVEVFRPEWLERHPPHEGPATEPVGTLPTPSQLEDGGEQQVLSRLKALGYLE